MIKRFIYLIILIILGGIVLAIAFSFKSLDGIKPIFTKPTDDTDKVLDTNDDPLKLPADFSIEVFAKNLPNARTILIDSFNNLWVSQPKEGTITLLEVSDGKVVNQNAVFRGLNNPHGLTLDPDDPFLLYIAEEDKISTIRLYSDGPMEKIIDLPEGDRHFTRTIRFGLDKRLYVSIGSTCNVCDEKDPRHAAIYSMERDGSDFKNYASGLRNAVFFTLNPTDGKFWATEMGRDLLGDDLPPDEINIIEENKNYGWPICYGKNTLDSDFHKDDHVHIRPDCSEPFEIPSFVDIPAHSAPLGLAFIPQGWPQEMQNDLLVAYHGSWNRSTPTGYKVVRMKLGKSGEYLGTEDFITGWLTPDNKSFGRPVDIVALPDGTAYVSDDKAGVIYKVSYAPTK